MHYFFDSYAIMEIVNGNPEYEKFSGFIFITNTLNLTEIYFSLIKSIGEENANDILGKLNFEFLEITPEIAIEAAKLKFKNKKLNLSYADSIGYIAAIKNNLIFLTGDKDFEKFDNVEFVK